MPGPRVPPPHVPPPHVPLPHVPLPHVPPSHVPLPHVPRPRVPPPHVPPRRVPRRACPAARATTNAVPRLRYGECRGQPGRTGAVAWRLVRWSRTVWVDVAAFAGLLIRTPHAGGVSQISRWQAPSGAPPPDRGWSLVRPQRGRGTCRTLGCEDTDHGRNSVAEQRMWRAVATVHDDRRRLHIAEPPLSNARQNRAGAGPDVRGVETGRRIAERPSHEHGW